MNFANTLTQAASKRLYYRKANSSQHRHWERKKESPLPILWRFLVFKDGGTNMGDHHSFFPLALFTHLYQTLSNRDLRDGYAPEVLWLLCSSFL